MEKTNTCACHELLPGYNFEPTAHKLVKEFLKKKKSEAPVSLRNKNDDPKTQILNLNVYKSLDHPDQLPAKRYRIDSGERKWFIHSPNRRDLNVKRSNRRTDDGYRKTSRDIPTKSNKNVIIGGYRSSLAFNKHNNETVPDQHGGSTKSDWHMHEYRCEKTSTRKRTFERDMKLDDRISVSDGAAIYGEVLAIQLSPKRALHVASLKKRFADTIMKAQDKILVDHGDRSDHEKMQKEKERLVKKLQREEKTRIEAAAQTRTVVESKRQRQKEREAARIALQMVEKTVEIDENRYIIKELVMLSGLSPSDLESTAVSRTVFNPRIGNPLERLGLFLKSNYLGDKEEEDMIFDAVCE